MYKKLRKTKSGQISVEAAIIVPIVIIVVASFIYMAFYTHDVITIRSGVYSMAIEEKGSGVMPALFVISPKIVNTENTIQNKMSINMESKGNTNFINNIIHRKKEEILTVQKTMNSEILYVSRALLDTKKGGEH